MFEKQTTEDSAKNIFTKPAQEIDLHIEKLVTDHSRMNNAQILELQLKTFEKNLDQAIASGMNEIIFIHGVGNGVLLISSLNMSVIKLLHIIF
ncbi:MAG: hypothetical protein K2X86_09515 [Cytophagaceae bacterium]|nr:hypothetical protein [Cytophagaceae bacterium]